ncbi:MAG: hypothetical protein PHQ53_04610 [Candidatus Krumholzibacteria bacterium]|nr:hypothetical protein [Candidatus Krumholzibacteria bacterium]
MRSYLAALFMATVPAVMSHATDFCTIVIRPTDKLVIMVGQNGDFSRVLSTSVTLSETSAGLYVDDNLVISRVQPYSQEELEIQSRHPSVRAAVAAGVDLHSAVVAYMETREGIFYELYKLFREHIDSLTGPEIIPLAEQLLDRLDPDREYVVGFEPDPRDSDSIYMYLPEFSWIDEYGIEPITPITVDRFSSTRERSEDGKSFITRINPFLDCERLAAVAATAASLGAGDRLICIVIGGGWGVDINTYLNEDAMWRNVEERRRLGRRTR